MPMLQQAAALAIEDILLATDFTPNSENAGKYAKAFAKRFGSRLEIAHVFNPSVVTSYEEAIVPMTAFDRKETSDENLAIFAKNLHLDGIATRLVSTEDHNASAALLKIANDDHADLIVTGTDSKTGLSRLILGSTAEQLLRWASCPVLTVGPRARTLKPGPLEFKTIIYATDFSVEASKAASYALSFAQEDRATLLCCCVLDANDRASGTKDEVDKAFEQRLRDLMPDDSYDLSTPRFVVEYGEAAEAILRLAADHDADLIVLGARRATYWLRRVTGGLTPQLLAHAKCPLLTIS